MNTKNEILEALKGKPSTRALYLLGASLGLSELCEKASGEPHISYRGRAYTIFEAPMKAVDKELIDAGFDLEELTKRTNEKLAEIRAKFSKESA